MTTDDRIDTILGFLETYKAKGRPKTNEELEDRLAFEDQNFFFLRNLDESDASPEKALSLHLAWTQFLTMTGIANRDPDELRVSQRKRDPRRLGWREPPTLVALPEGPKTTAAPEPPSVPPLQVNPIPTSESKHLRLQRLSELLPKFLAERRRADGDGRAEDDIKPIVLFAIKLLGDPPLVGLSGDNLLELRTAMGDIPTTKGFSTKERDLFTRWQIAKECGFVRIGRDGETVNLVRVGKSTIDNRYGAGLNAIWKWAAGLDTSLPSTPPNFSAPTVLNPGKKKRDAFAQEELERLFSMPLFQRCERPPRVWQTGTFFYQNFFYWSVLITLLSGLRPGEISQLRCLDILELYGKPHFRFAKFSGGSDEEVRDEDRPGGNVGKSKAAYRWIPVHPLLIRLGLLNRRDSLLSFYFKVTSGTKSTNFSFEDASEETIKAASDLWLFPDWKVYVKSNGGIMWSHTTTKAWAHLAQNYGFDRNGISFYSARHTFKGFIDDIRGLSDRSRLVVMGHSTEGTVDNQYGPKRITEEQSDIILNIDNETIRKVTEILISAKERAERKELIVLDAWKIDERSDDAKFQEAIKKRMQQFI